MTKWETRLSALLRLLWFAFGVALLVFAMLWQPAILFALLGCACIYASLILPSK